MARPLRLEFPGALYHVTSRGDGREDIYVVDGDREEWLAVLGEACQRFNWMAHAYCQMTNHYHVLVETPDGNLSRGMRQLNGVYTQRFNRAKLTNQVYLGSDQFVEQMQGHLKPDRDLSEVPVGQKRRVAPPLNEYERVSGGRDEAIVAAYVSGGYTMKELGEHFGLHYSRISKIVRDSLAKRKT